MGGLYDNNSYINYNDSVNVVQAALRGSPRAPRPPPGHRTGIPRSPGDTPRAPQKHY